MTLEEVRRELKDNLNDAYEYEGGLTEFLCVLLNCVEKEISTVHCKECKHWGTGYPAETDHVKCCSLAKYMIGENGSCTYGARKEE